MTTILLYVAIGLFAGLLMFLILALLNSSKNYDGKLVWNEEHDSWEIAITTKPEDLQYKKYIKLKVIKE